MTAALHCDQQVARRAVRRPHPAQGQQQEREDLAVGQPFAVDLGFGQRADQVVLRNPASVGENLGEVGLQRGGRGDPDIPVVDDGQRLDRELLEAHHVFQR